MAEQKEAGACGMCKMHGTCHSWVLRAILMITILGIVFTCGVVTGEVKATLRGMRGYGMMQRGGWDYNGMRVIKGYPADTLNPDSVLYE